MFDEVSDSWSTKREILSLYAHDYTKPQLITMVPGLSKWRIDEACKHAALFGPGKPLDVPNVHRLKLDQVKVDHFIDFVYRVQIICKMLPMEHKLSSLPMEKHLKYPMW